MDFCYVHAALPTDRDLVGAAAEAAERVHSKLTRAGIDGPAMDDYYRKRYYSNFLKAPTSKLRNAAYHVMWAVAQCGKPLEEISLLDHGSGLGIIGLVAKERGVGRVIFNDIDPRFLDAARGLGAMIGAEGDQYILGDVDELVRGLGSEPVDAAVSYDVLEHIYDLDAFFETLCAAPGRPRNLFMSSGANMFSLYFVWTVLPIQRRREAIYAARRIGIIRECAPELPDRDTLMLCKKTRMLRKDEIEAVVERYLEDKAVELPPKCGANAYDPYRSNTVDPDTGWWAEHFFNPFYLRGKLARYGYDVCIRPGYYGGKGGAINGVIRRLGGRLGLPLANFYTVAARQQAAEESAPARVPERAVA